MESLNKVIGMLRDMFVRREVIELIGEQSCFEELIDCDQDNKKAFYTKRQDHLYDQISRIEDSLIELIEQDKVEIGLNEDDISTDILKALQIVQKNPIYRGKKENTINDGIRDALTLKYEVKDQTRQGLSVDGNDAGEIDLLLFDKGIPLALMEGLKLDSVNSGRLSEHIEKAMTNYDPIGCPMCYVLIYATMERFEEFWGRIISFMSRYKFPYDVAERFHEVRTSYTESRHGKAVLRRSGKQISFHLYAVAMK